MAFPNTKLKEMSVPSPENIKNYSLQLWIYRLAHLTGLLSMISLSIWMFSEEKGDIFMRLHPQLISFGLLLMNGEAIMLYRGFRFSNKIYTKTIHAFTQTTGLVVIFLGILSIYTSKKVPTLEEPRQHWISPHSWLGIMTIVLYVMQWLAGLCSFYNPMASITFSDQILPLHRANGIFIFILSFCSALMGITRLSEWTMDCWQNNNGYLCQKIIASNMFAIFTAIFVGCVLCIVGNPAWIRQPLPDEFVVEEVAKNREKNQKNN